MAAGSPSTYCKSITINNVVTVWFFTYVGVMWRVAMTTLCENSGNEALRSLGNSFFLANLIGSFVMGLAYGMTDLFKPYQSWHVGITVGFCGSCTTFSSWQRSVALQFITKQVITALVQLFVVYVGSYCIFCHGLHLGKVIKSYFDKRRIDSDSKTGDNNGQTQQTTTYFAVARQRPNGFSTGILILLLITMVITGALWCGVFLDNRIYRRRWWVALALAPAGSLLRYSLSVFNPKYPAFPLFTFLVNAVGSALSMSAYVGDNFIVRYYEKDDVVYESYDFWITNGLAVGVLGSLTTVSTFVREIYQLSNVKMNYAYRYVFISVTIAQLCCLIIGCATFA